MTDNTKHEPTCPFVLPTRRKKSKAWFETMGIKNNCPSCNATLEFK